MAQIDSVVGFVQDVMFYLAPLIIPPALLYKVAYWFDTIVLCHISIEREKWHLFVFNVI